MGEQLDKTKSSQNREKIISKLKEFFARNASLYDVEMVFLYGSWASGFPREDSDIDLAVVFSSKIDSDEQKFSLITEISYNLISKLGLDVNIISIYEDFRHPMLYYNAIVMGIPVFIKSEGRLFDLKMEAICQMEDFAIFGIPWQLEIAKRNLEGR